MFIVQVGQKKKLRYGKKNYRLQGNAKIAKKKKKRLLNVCAQMPLVLKTLHRPTHLNTLRVKYNNGMDMLVSTHSLQHPVMFPLIVPSSLSLLTISDGVPEFVNEADSDEIEDDCKHGSIDAPLCAHRDSVTRPSKEDQLASCKCHQRHRHILYFFNVKVRLVRVKEMAENVSSWSWSCIAFMSLEKKVESKMPHLHFCDHELTEGGVNVQFATDDDTRQNQVEKHGDGGEDQGQGKESSAAPLMVSSDVPCQIETQEHDDPHPDHVRSRYELLN